MSTLSSDEMPNETSSTEMDVCEHYDYNAKTNAEASRKGRAKKKEELTQTPNKKKKKKRRQSD